MSVKTLIVKHLPEAFNEILCKDFFTCFGACSVRYMGQNGRLKRSAFVDFLDDVSARAALFKLHQLSFMNTTLTAEFCKNFHIESSVSNLENIALGEAELSENEKTHKETIKQKVNKEINFITKDFNYCINPGLLYSYPSPTTSTLLNITHALVSFPSFYQQVIHLMNKMNLPPPFKNIYNSDLQISSEESEYDSSTEDIIILNNKTRKRKQKIDISETTKKRLKLQLLIEAQLQKAVAKNVKNHDTDQKLDKVFEVGEVKSKKIGIQINKKIESSICHDVTEVVNNESLSDQHEGFGKLKPPKKDTVNDKIDHRKENKELNEKPCKNVPLESSSLYVKNLSKHVTEEDLHNIFKRFVDLSDKHQEESYHIRLMTQGRMRGQAFVTLPTVELATQALHFSNNYQLFNKPMNVSYARSAKLS